MTSVQLFSMTVETNELHMLKLGYPLAHHEGVELQTFLTLALQGVVSLTPLLPGRFSPLRWRGGGHPTVPPNGRLDALEKRKFLAPHGIRTS